MMGRLQGVMERLILLGLAAVPTALAKKIVSVSGVCTTTAKGNLLFGRWRGPLSCWSPGGGVWAGPVESVSSSVNTACFL